MKRALLFASLIVLTGAGAGTATAGPIQWSYSAEVEYSRDYGNDFLLNWTNQSGTVTSGAGEYTSRDLFTTTAFPGPPRDDNGQIAYNFTVRLTLKDIASGESAVLAYNGWYATQWDKKWTGEDENGNPTWDWDWIHEQSEFGKPTSWDWVTLGGNVYTLRGEGGGMGTTPNGALVLSVSPTATPEPTTLALAGIGLTALGVARRVRGRNTAARVGTATA